MTDWVRWYSEGGWDGTDRRESVCHLITHPHAHKAACGKPIQTECERHRFHTPPADACKTCVKTWRKL